MYMKVISQVYLFVCDVKMLIVRDLCLIYDQVMCAHLWWLGGFQAACHGYATVTEDSIMIFHRRSVLSVRIYGQMLAFYACLLTP